MMVGHVMWELIQPLDDESLFAKFLADKGEGVHHIAVRTPNYDETVAKEAERGQELAFSCKFQDIKLAYLPTDKNLGVLLEVFSALPGDNKT